MFGRIKIHREFRDFIPEPTGLEPLGYSLSHVANVQ